MAANKGAATAGRVCCRRFLLLILIAAAFYMYRRRKIARVEAKQSKPTEDAAADASYDAINVETEQRRPNVENAPTTHRLLRTASRCRPGRTPRRNLLAAPDAGVLRPGLHSQGLMAARRRAADGGHAARDVRGARAGAPTSVSAAATPRWWCSRTPPARARPRPPTTGRGGPRPPSSPAAAADQPPPPPPKTGEV